MKLDQRKSASVLLGAMLLLSAATAIFGPGPAATAGSAGQFATAAGLDGTNANPAGPSIVAGLGIIEPASGTINLSALMPGVLARIYKSEGDTIIQGEVLAELVNDDLKALVAQAESSVRLEAARLALIENGPRPEEIEQAEARVREELSSKELFETQLQRREALVREGAVARERLNEVENALNVSLERLDGASKQLDMLRQGSRAEDVEAARASYKLAQDKLDEARAMLNKSYVRATIDGVVLRRYMEPGEVVSMQPGAVVMQIADTSRLVVRTQIDENDIGGLKVGQRAEVSAPSLAGQTLKGTVSRISPRLGAKTVTAETPTEKRDTRVLDVMVTLDAGVAVPIYLRVDVVIDLDSQAEISPQAQISPAVDVAPEAEIKPLAELRVAPSDWTLQADTCPASGCAGNLQFLDTEILGSITP